MKRVLIYGLVFSFFFAAINPAGAQNVTKEKLPPSIFKYLVTAAPEYSIMVKAINAAKLESTFEGPGPITVFAPVNKAFDILAAGSVEQLLKPEMIDSLQKILTNHIIAGSWTASELEQKIREAGGEFFVPTIGEAGKLSFMLENNKVVVKDAHGFKTELGIPSKQENGLVYRLDKLLLP
ncbi:MAG: fasciclin domain-containing protein [Taibaiella sp.]|jgi:uncharacterized surface protein with fasciclin (FAS1) repeats